MQKQIEQKNRLTEDEIEAEKTLYKAGEDLKNARRHLEIVQLEQEQLSGEASDIDDEMTKYNAAIAKISDEIHAAQGTVAETSQKISDVSSQMEQFNQTVVDLKMQLTALSAKLENSNNSLRRLKEFHEDGLMRLEQLSREINHKRQKEESSKLNITGHEEKLCDHVRCDKAYWMSLLIAMKSIISRLMPGSKTATVKYPILKAGAKNRWKNSERSNLKCPSSNSNAIIPPTVWRNGTRADLQY